MFTFILIKLLNFYVFLIFLLYGLYLTDLDNSKLFKFLICKIMHK